eukprot:5177712-Amphidinium_carterae.1
MGVAWANVGRHRLAPERRLTVSRLQEVVQDEHGQVIVPNVLTVFWAIRCSQDLCMSSCL